MQPSTFGTIPIPLNDYLGLVRPRRRAVRAALAGLLAIAIFTAGAVPSWPWRDTKSMTLETALSVLHSAPREDWQTNIGTGVTFRSLERGVAMLAQVSVEDNKQGIYAALYMRNLGVSIITAVKGLDRDSPNSSTHKDTLKRFVNTLNN